jgi:hypothetical protein
MSPFATNTRKVNVLTENGWQTFQSVTDAAKYIGVAPCTLSTKLIKDLPCRDFSVRYHDHINL